MPGIVNKLAMGNSTLPTVCDKLNLIASIHNRKLTATMTRELKEKDVKIKQLSDKVIELENTVKMIMDKLRASDDDLTSNQCEYGQSNSIGWILDVRKDYVSNNIVILIKLVDGKVISFTQKLNERTFYIIPNSIQPAKISYNNCPDMTN